MFHILTSSSWPLEGLTSFMQSPHFGRDMVGQVQLLPELPAARHGVRDSDRFALATFGRQLLDVA